MTARLLSAIVILLTMHRFGTAFHLLPPGSPLPVFVQSDWWIVGLAFTSSVPWLLYGSQTDDAHWEAGLLWFLGMLAVGMTSLIFILFFG